MPPHAPPKKKSTKKKVTPRKAGSKRVAKTRAAKPRMRGPRVISIASPEPKVFRDLKITDVKVNGEERGPRIGASAATKSPAETALDDEALKVQKWADGKDYQQMPPGLPYIVSDDGQLGEGVKMWERVEAPEDEHVPMPPWYRRLWNWIKSI